MQQDHYRASTEHELELLTRAKIHLLFGKLRCIEANQESERQAVTGQRHGRVLNGQSERIQDSEP